MYFVCTSKLLVKRQRCSLSKLRKPCTNWQSFHQKRLKLLPAVGWQRWRKRTCGRIGRQQRRETAVWHNLESARFRHIRMREPKKEGCFPNRLNGHFKNNDKEVSLLWQNPYIKLNIYLPANTLNIFIRFGFTLVSLSIFRIRECLETYQVLKKFLNPNNFLLIVI